MVGSNRFQSDSIHQQEGLKSCLNNPHEIPTRRSPKEGVILTICSQQQIFQICAELVSSHRWYSDQVRLVSWLQ